MEVNGEPSPKHGHPSRSDVDDILRKKRKVREHKACYPCRTRKVRCDSQIPCKTCVDRNHAELCTFEPPSKRRESSSVTVTIRRDDWDHVCSKLHDIEASLGQLKEELRNINGFDDTGSETRHSPATSTGREKTPPNGPKYVKAMELTEQSEMTGEGIYLGGGSVPALVNALKNGDGMRPKVQEIFRTSMLPLFRLEDESATYPFVSLFGNQPAAARINELRKVLPDDAECLENFRQYKNGTFITYPTIPNIEDFERDIMTFLANRRENQGNEEGNQSSVDLLQMDGMNMRWIALLFAIFASGVQMANLPKPDRELLSQVYVCCSFECLRIVNYLSNTSLEVIQTLLVLGCVLSNGMNAGAAWTLLGMTIRLAQTLGLHTSCEKDPKTATPSDIQRSRTWWAILWQDSLLSVSYDRASSAATIDCSFPPSDGQPGNYSFRDCMQRICKVGLDTVRNRVAPQSIESRLSRCIDLRESISRTQSQATKHLRNVEACQNVQQLTEYWTLYLHASYMLAELCRPAISPSMAKFDKDRKLRAQSIIHLMNTVEAFVGLAGVSPVHTRSWPVSHRALSSALLLGILGEPTRNPRAQDLMSKLISLIRTIAAVTDGTELSGPVQRSLSALHKLSAPESRTPRTLEEAVSNTKSNVTAALQQGNHQPKPQRQPRIKSEPSPPGPANPAFNGTLAPAPNLASLNQLTSGPARVQTPTSAPSHHLHNALPNSQPHLSNTSTTRTTPQPTNHLTPNTTTVTTPNTAHTPPAVNLTDADTGPFSSLDFNAAAAGTDDGSGSFFLPSPLSGFEDESSPYALMDSIMWGGGGGAGGIDGLERGIGGF